MTRIVPAGSAGPDPAARKTEIPPRMRHLVLPDSSFFPRLQITHPAAFDLDAVLAEFLLSADEFDELGDAKAPDNTIRIELRQVNVPDRGSIDQIRAPRRGRRYAGPRPGQTFDLAAIRFQPMRGSTLWLSDRIPKDSNYVAQVILPLITHACATLGNGLVHSALIEYEGHGILLPGAGLSGKSSLSFFAMQCGARLVTDDLVLLGSGSRAPTGRGLRSNFLLRARTQALLPESLRSGGQKVNFGSEFKYRYPRAALGEHAIGEAPLAAIVFPSIDPDGAPARAPGYRLASMAKSEAMARLMRCVDTTVLMPGLDAERAAVTRSMVSLSRALPCFSLTHGPAFLDDPIAATRTLLETILSPFRATPTSLR